MQTLFIIWAVGAVTTYLFIYVLVMFVNDWDWLFDSPPVWWAKFNPFAWLEHQRHEHQESDLSYTEKLALHPFTTTLRTFRGILLMIITMLFFLSVYVLWPVTLFFFGYLFVRKLRLIRCRLRTHQA